MGVYMLRVNATTLSTSVHFDPIPGPDIALSGSLRVVNGKQLAAVYTSQYGIELYSAANDSVSILSVRPPHSRSARNSLSLLLK